MLNPIRTSLTHGRGGRTKAALLDGGSRTDGDTAARLHVNISYMEADHSAARCEICFTGPTPEALVRGRERTYFEHSCIDFAADKTHSISQADRVAYVAAYARPGRMRSGWAYLLPSSKRRILPNFPRPS